MFNKMSVFSVTFVVILLIYFSGITFGQRGYGRRSYGGGYRDRYSSGGRYAQRRRHYDDYEGQDDYDQDDYGLNRRSRDYDRDDDYGMGYRRRRGRGSGRSRVRNYNGGKKKGLLNFSGLSSDGKGKKKKGTSKKNEEYNKRHHFYEAPNHIGHWLFGNYDQIV